MEWMIQELPYLCLLWIGIGTGIILLSIFMLAKKHSEETEYTHKLEKIFPALVEQKQVNYTKKESAQQELLTQIENLMKEGLGAEEIARKLKIGVGEVNLMIALYTMK